MEEHFAKRAYRSFLLWGICSSLGVTVSTLIDAVLVGNLVGSDGLAVTNMSTPVFLLYSLLGITIGTGASIFIGRQLGEADIQEANRTFHVQLCTGLVIGLSLMAVLVLLRDRICLLLGAQDTLFSLAGQYLSPVFFSAPIFVLYHIFALSVRTDGDPKRAALAAAVVIMVNLCLDLFFMMGLGMGIAGASLSLCIAEALGVVVLLTHFLKKTALLRLRLRIPHGRDLVYFAENGFGVGSAFLFQGVMIFVFNTLLLAAGSEGVVCVAVFGVIYTISLIPFAVFEGAGNALSTVVSIFAGERDRVSIQAVMKRGRLIVRLTGIAMSAVIWLCSDMAAVCFGLTDPEEREMAAEAVRLFSLSVLLTGINMIITAFWQSVGRARLAGAMSIARNFILMILLGGVLIPRYQIAGLSLTYVWSEALCLAWAAAVEFFCSSGEYLKRMYPDSGRIFERYYPIQEQSVVQISEDLESLCDEWGIQPRQALFINLIVEELLLNIAKFGLKNHDEKCYISVRLMENGGEYIMRIRDNVKTYNPFDPDNACGDAVDAAVLGMIQKKTKYCSYQRKLIFNYLYLVI